MNPPPFLVSFSDGNDFLKALPEEMLVRYEDEILKLCNRNLPPVVSIRCLAALFGYSSKFTGALYRNTEKYYRVFLIQTGKKKRVIQAPKVALKVIQKWFGFHLAEVIEFKPCVFGFIKGRSAIEAAALHCGADWVYSVDIADFFPSTPKNMVEHALKDLGYSEKGAEIVAKICCYNGFLSQGSPASPILSNLVFKDVDSELMTLAQMRGNLRYTRYADDVVFSGTGNFPEDIKNSVRSIIESRGWKIAESKEWLGVRPNRLKVHGLLVHGKNPRLTKGYRNRIRAFRHLLAKGVVRDEDIEHIRGHLAYAQSVEKSGG